MARCIMIDALEARCSSRQIFLRSRCYQLCLEIRFYMNINMTAVEAASGAEQRYDFRRSVSFHGSYCCEQNDHHIAGPRTSRESESRSIWQRFHDMRRGPCAV